MRNPVDQPSSGYLLQLDGLRACAVGAVLVPILLFWVDLHLALLLGWLQFDFLLGITVGMAAILWHFYELPLNSRKDYLARADQNISTQSDDLTAAGVS